MEETFQITGEIEGGTYKPKVAKRIMKAFDYIKGIKNLPPSVMRGISRPSNGEIFRWLSDGGIAINGKRPEPYEWVEFPITELIFFPSSKRKVTMVKE